MDGREFVAGGFGHTCEIVNEAVRCWGSNFFGQLGTGDFQDRFSPSGYAATSGAVSAVATGDGFSCAIVGSGVRCWGYNYYGQLGNGQAGCDPEELWDCKSATPVTVSGLAGVTAIAAADDHTCAVANGGVRCWGSNLYGQLGNGGPTGLDENGVPMHQINPVPVTGLGAGVTGIAVGTNHSCAVTGAGAVKCWGSNGFGQLGDGTKTDRGTPVTVSKTGAAAIATGWDHSCLITTKGGVACWGRNQFGEIGDGTERNRFRPTPVSGLGNGSEVLQVTGGYQFTCALLPLREVRCWGRNDFGQLGDGTTTTRTKPVLTLFDCLGKAPTIAAQPGQATMGTSGDDVIVGTNAPDLIDGQGGHDRICGFGGGDGIVGGNLSVAVDGGAGADEIAGGDDLDILNGGAGNDSISGGLSNDDLYGDDGEDELRGDKDDDVIFGGEGVDLLLGSDGEDILRGEEGATS